MTFERFPLETLALYPIAVLFDPPVLVVRAPAPTAVLFDHVLLYSADAPIAVLLAPVVLELSAHCQNAELLSHLLLFSA